MTQTWEEYCENSRAVYSEITEGDRQTAILTSVVGAATYSLMANLLSPEKLKDKTYQELVSLRKNHFDPEAK